MVAALHDIHPAVVAAVTKNAELEAELVGECLDILDRRLKQDGVSTGASGLPVGFLLELGAICQLKLWELKGLRPFLPSDLPTCEDAASDLHRRATSSPDSFASIQGDRLGPRVLDIWLERFSWDAPNLLKADIVLGEVDEDALVDALANLLWDHRHELAGLE